MYTLKIIYLYWSISQYCCCCLVAKLCPTLWPPWTIAHQAPLFMGFLRQEPTGVGYHFLLQGIFSTQRSNPGLLLCRRILYYWATWEVPYIHFYILFHCGLSQDIKYSSLCYTAVLQKGGSLLGPKSGLLSNTWKWLVWGNTCADKTSDLIGKGCPGRTAGSGTQENSYSAIWLEVLGFIVMGFLGCLWLIILTQGPSWWHVHYSVKIDSSEKDSGRLVGHMD